MKFLKNDAMVRRKFITNNLFHKIEKIGFRRKISNRKTR